MSSRYRLPLSLALCFLTSLLLRILPPFDQIFTPIGIKFAMNDAYYHMRLVDNLAHNFPNFSYYDPYFVFPGTTVIGGVHLFDWLLATIAWVVGLGVPTQSTIDMVGVYIPPILAAMLVIPVYFTGKSVFNKWAGLIAAGLVAILPGEFLGRSILGAADHHVAEVLFSTTAVMLLVLAIRSVSTRQTRIFTILAGVVMGVYLLTWEGGLLFVGIIGLFVFAQIIINHLRVVSSFRIAGIATAIFGIATFMNVSNTMPREVMLVLGLSVVLPIGLAVMSWVARELRWPSAIFLPAIPIAGILSLLIVNWVYPPFISYLGMLLPSGSTAATTLELQPMLAPHGQFTLSVLWGNFTTTAVLASVALVVLIGAIIKDKGKDEARLLLVIWSVVMIALMLNQRRYAYYAVVNMALLSGYLVYLTTIYCGMVRKKHKGLWITSLSAPRLWLVLPIVVLVLVPLNLSAAIQTSRAATFAPPDAWQSAMLWMRDNTSEPFGVDLYGDYISRIPEDALGSVEQDIFIVNGKQYLRSPEPDYAVSAWWDYGYWITRIGHRVPNANPAQNIDAVERVAGLLLSTKEDYRGLADYLKSGYVVLDSETASGKFYAVVSWADKNISDYFRVYSVPDKDNGYRSIVLFYPEYYETLVSRLYNFNGEAVIPERTVVITARDNIVLDAKEFADYQKAQEYVDLNPNTRIVSADPAVSPVPLEKVNYELVYEYDEIKIFEYTGGI
jgi:dolichyl-diphosphooligosaccharide--protein glycosyltransferase